MGLFSTSEHVFRVQNVPDMLLLPGFLLHISESPLNGRSALLLVQGCLTLHCKPVQYNEHTERFIKQLDDDVKMS